MANEKTQAQKTYAEQLEELFTKIRTDLGYPIVLGLQVYDKPKDEESEDENKTKYPFIGYNIISQRRVANIPRTEQKDDMVKTIWDEQYEVTISFVAAAQDPFEAMEASKKLFEWLSNTGKGFMLSKQIAHVASTAITTRDFLFINNYERRSGFDCRLRMGREVEYEIPRIETVEVQPGTIL